MPSIYLFRLKAIKAAQGALFEKRISREEFLTSVIESKPSEELREGYIWHVGNVLKVGKDGLLFAAGRTTKKAKSSTMKSPAISFRWKMKSPHLHTCIMIKNTAY